MMKRFFTLAMMMVATHLVALESHAQGAQRDVVNTWTFTWSDETQKALSLTTTWRKDNSNVCYYEVAANNEQIKINNEDIIPGLTFTASKSNIGLRSSGLHLANNNSTRIHLASLSAGNIVKITSSGGSSNTAQYLEPESLSDETIKVKEAVDGTKTKSQTYSFEVVAENSYNFKLNGSASLQIQKMEVYENADASNPIEGKSWDFQSLYSTQFTETVLACLPINNNTDGMRWSYNSAPRYEIGSTLESTGPLKVWLSPISETNGLTFTTTATGKIRIMLESSNSLMLINGYKVTVTIPSVPAGGRVTIKTNVAGRVTDNSGNAPSSTENSGKDYIFDIASAGDFTFKITGDVKIYSISVEGPETTALTSENVSVEAVTYNGTEQTAVVKYNSETLTKDTDYTVTGTDVLTNAGSTTFTIAGAGNYTGTVSDLTFTITPKEVTVNSGITANNKVYDGNTTATLVLTGATIDGKVGEDELIVSSATGSFADANVSENKDVTISDISLGGVKAGNYTLSATGNQTTTTATITQATNSLSGDLTISGWAYGTTANTPSGVSAAFGTVGYKYSNASDGTYGTYDAIVKGAEGTWWVKAYVEGTDNYTAVESDPVSFTISSATQTATITAEATQSTTYNGQAQPLTASVDQGTIIITYYTNEAHTEGTTTEAPTNAGTYYTIVSQSDANYTSDPVNVTYTIQPKALTITAKAQTIAYGGSIETGVNQVEVSGLVSGDALTAIKLTPSTTEVTADGTITPSAAETTNGALNYDITYNPGNLTINEASQTTPPTQLAENPALFANLTASDVTVSSNTTFYTYSDESKEYTVTKSEGNSGTTGLLELYIKGTVFKYNKNNAKFTLRANDLQASSTGALITIPGLKQNQVVIINAKSVSSNKNSTFTINGTSSSNSVDGSNGGNMIFVAQNDGEMVLNNSEAGYCLYSITLANTLETSVNNVTMGEVSVSPTNSLGENYYLSGSTLTLTATANAGYEFKEWQEYKNDEWTTINSATTETLELTMDGNKNVRAVFEAVNYTFKATAGENGSITVMKGEANVTSAVAGESGDTYPYGTTLVLTPTATNSDEYEFDKWTTDGTTELTTSDDISIDATTNVLTVSLKANLTVVATFKAKTTTPTTYSITLPSEVNGNSVTANVNAISSVAENTSVTLTIHTAENYTLANISATGVTLSGSGDTRTFTMPAANVTITANWKEKTTESAKTEVTENVDIDGTQATITSVEVGNETTTITISGTVSDGTNNVPVTTIAEGTFTTANTANVQSIDLSKTQVALSGKRSTNSVLKDIPENTLVYLPSTSNGVTGDNVIIYDGDGTEASDYTCNNFVMTDKKSYSVPKTFTATNATLSRSFTNGVTCTVCLPYNVPAGNLGGKIYQFSEVDGATVKMTEKTGDLVANTPYIFVPSSNATQITASTVTINMSDTPNTSPNGQSFTFKGVFGKKEFTAEEISGGVYGFAADSEHGASVGQFVKASNGAWTEGMRAYLAYSGNLSETGVATTRGEGLPEYLNVVLVSASGSTTNIGRLELITAEDGSPVYNLNGQRVDNSYKGIVIKNGKKVIKK